MPPRSPVAGTRLRLANVSPHAAIAAAEMAAFGSLSRRPQSETPEDRSQSQLLTGHGNAEPPFKGFHRSHVCELIGPKGKQGCYLSKSPVPALRCTISEFVTHDNVALFALPRQFLAGSHCKTWETVGRHTCARGGNWCSTHWQVSQPAPPQMIEIAFKDLRTASTSAVLQRPVASVACAWRSDSQVLR